MKLIIDQEIDQEKGVVLATQYYDLDAPGSFEHPSGNKEPCTIADVITYYQAHPELHERAGLHVVSQLPHEDSPRSRWQRVQDHIDSDECHPSLVHLKGGKDNAGTA